MEKGYSRRVHRREFGAICEQKGELFDTTQTSGAEKNLVKLIDPFCDPSERVEMTLAHASESESV